MIVKSHKNGETDRVARSRTVFKNAVYLERGMPYFCICGHKRSASSVLIKDITPQNYRERGRGEPCAPAGVRRTPLRFACQFKPSPMGKVAGGRVAVNFRRKSVGRMRRTGDVISKSFLLIHHSVVPLPHGGRLLKMRTIPKPPLCKGRCRGTRRRDCKI